MKNIIISQFKQLHNTKLKFIVWALCLLVELILLWFMKFYYDYDVDDTIYEMFGSGFMVCRMSMMITFVMFFIFTAVGDICAGDFNDKTIYTELLSGGTRTRTYFGRAITAIIFTMVGSLLLFYIPLLICTVLFGWGTLFSAGVLLERSLLLLAPLLRLICTVVCISFLVKNKYVVIAVGFALMEAFGILGSAIAKAPDELLGMSSAAYVLRFDEWVTFGLSESLNVVINPVIPTGKILSITIVSLAAAAVFLFIGWSSFKREDLN